MNERLERKLSLKEKRFIKDQLMKEKRSEEYDSLEEVFNKSTLMALYKLLNLKIIKEIYGALKSGKEAKIYFGTLNTQEKIAIKIYLTTSAEFRKGMIRYIEGDPRFRKVKRDTKSLIYLWAKKEFRNLQIAYKAGISVPKPILVEKNILLMEFIGNNNWPAPLLKEVMITNPNKIYKAIISQIIKLYQKGHLVHADLSEYNIMMLKNKPVMIDFSQAIHKDHPLATQFLIRDLTNINKFFNQLNTPIKPIEEILEGIVT